MYRVTFISTCIGEVAYDERACGQKEAVAKARKKVRKEYVNPERFSLLSCVRIDP